jgi:NADH dehydrogenase FAD-containing subunit
LPNIEGLKEHAFLFNTIQDAQRIAERISDPNLNGNIVIAGGPIFLVFYTSEVNLDNW